MSSFFAAVGRLSVRFRWLVVLFWLVGAVATVRVLPPLSSVVKNDNQQFLPASAPSQKAAQLARPFVGDSNDAVIVVASTASGAPLSPADEAAVAREASLASTVPHVVGARVVGLSPDRSAAQIQIRVHIDHVSNNQAKGVLSGVRATFPRAGPPEGLTLHAAGALADSVAVDAQAKGNGSRTQELSLLFIVVLLLAVFRSVLAPLATLLPAALVLQIAGPIIAEIARLGIQVSSITQLLLIVLVLGAGTDYGLFLVFRVREELSRGLPHREAVVAGLARVGESITFSAATVIAALLSLLAASFGVYHGLGVPLAVGVGLMLLAGLTLLPAILAIMGRGLFWPSRWQARSDATGLWGRIAARVVRRPVQTLAIGVAVFGALAIASIGNKPAGFAGAVTPPAASDAAAGDAVLAAHFPRASANPTSLVLSYSSPVWDHPGSLVRARSVLARDPLFSNVLGPLDPQGTPLAPGQLAALHRRLGDAATLPPLQPTAGPAASVPPAAYQAYRGTAELISPDGRTVQLLASLSAGDPAGTKAIQAVPAIRRALQAAATASGATASGVAGEAPALYDVNATSSADLGHIVPIAIAVIGILLALLLRSLVAPLYLIVSVGLSYLAALGVCVLAFIVVGGDAGITFILPFLMFIFLLALGEDYNILVMSRIREEARGRPLTEAVTRAVGVTGTTVTSAGLVLAGTFVVFAVAGSGGPGGSEIREIGIGLATGVLMDTFLVRTILVPSTVVLLDRWNWWPSHLARRPASHEPAERPAVPGAATDPAAAGSRGG
ncbi:MAG: MMPL family transporter [Acidimicrobiales bacterium]